MGVRGQRPIRPETVNDAKKEVELLSCKCESVSVPATHAGAGRANRLSHQ